MLDGNVEPELSSCPCAPRRDALTTVGHTRGVHVLL
jgi:hypothetical protein